MAEQEIRQTDPQTTESRRLKQDASNRSPHSSLSPASRRRHSRPFYRRVENKLTQHLHVPPVRRWSRPGGQCYLQGVVVAKKAHFTPDCSGCCPAVYDSSAPVPADTSEPKLAAGRWSMHCHPPAGLMVAVRSVYAAVLTLFALGETS
jgi:hypothetical protein